MSKELLNTSPLDQKSLELAQKILDTDNLSEVKDLTALFNLNSQKRQVMRSVKMNDLLDKITEQVVERFENAPQNFTNDELLKYLQVTENSIEKANKTLGLVEEAPMITYQQNNQVNISIGDQLGTESRQKIAEAVQSILNKAKNNVIEIDDIDSIEGEYANDESGKHSEA